MGAQDISWLNLGVGYILLAIPLAIIRYFRIGLERDLIISIGRMSVQLFLVGAYLEVIFKLNHSLLNLLWLLVMIVVTSFTVLQRSSLPVTRFFFPILGAIALSVFMVDWFILKLILQREQFSEAAYLIPISGMLLGNMLADMVVSVNSFFQLLGKQQNTYRFALANGATHQEALHPFLRDALKISINRGLASTAVMGLVSLPGMMTGQILGGSSPAVAVKYQIMIMLLIFIGSSACNFLALRFSISRAFDSYKNFRLKE